MNIRQFSKLPKEEQLKLLFKRVEEMKKEYQKLVAGQEQKESVNKAEYEKIIASQKK